MAVHVEALQRTGAGVLYSVPHYYESNGDLVLNQTAVLSHTVPCVTAEAAPTSLFDCGPRYGFLPAS